LNNNARLENRTELGLRQLLTNSRLNANDKEFIQEEINRRAVEQKRKNAQNAFDTSYKRWTNFKNKARLNSLESFNKQLKSQMNILGNDAKRKANYNTFVAATNLVRLKNRIAKVKGLKNSGSLASYPDLMGAFNKGNYAGWNANSVKRFNEQYNLFFNTNGKLKYSNMVPATGGAAYGKGGVNYKDDIKSSYGSGGKIHIRTLKNGNKGYYLMTAPGKYWPIVNVSRNKATSKILYHINTAYPYTDPKARQPRRQLGVSL
jgi:hypothetical protein